MKQYEQTKQRFYMGKTRYVYITTNKHKLLLKWKTNRTTLQKFKKNESKFVLHLETLHRAIDDMKLNKNVGRQTVPQYMP